MKSAKQIPIQSATPDVRHLSHGREIPTESYSDQPFIVRTDDGAWLCCVTTGPGGEGEQGQHVATLRSSDQGKTWSGPEIVLYDNDPYVRISYPDLVEEGGKYYLTETEKDIARVHEIQAELPEGMWAALAMQLGQGDGPAVTDENRLLALPVAGKPMPAAAPLPLLPWFRVRDGSVLDFRGKDTGEGVALELEMVLADLMPGRVLRTFEAVARSAVGLGRSPRT